MKQLAKRAAIALGIFAGVAVVAAVATWFYLLLLAVAT